MEELNLDSAYIERLEDLAGEIQESEELQQYLETEEEEHYLHLKELYEPRIAALHEEVALENPLQVESLEKVLLDPAFEGLFLPKILGYSVLRGEYDAHYKYTRPQEHFKDVLLTICNSTNFEILKKRIGQSIQIGFALSSDIWITNLINSIPNKRVRYYLQAQKLERYRHDHERAIGYARYKQQFRHDHYQTANFPDTLVGLQIQFTTLKQFLLHRVRIDANNASLIGPLRQFVENPNLQGTPEHLQIMSLYANFFPLEAADHAHLAKHFNAIRTSMPEFAEHYMAFLLEMLENQDSKWSADADKRVSALLDRSISDDLSAYYDLMDQVHGKGYINPEVQEAVKLFCDSREGLSDINECVRQTIFRYFAGFINNLEATDYPDYFEITKLFPVYMGIFRNQLFNQNLEKTSMRYLRSLLKQYTDKRGKDYQDIKKFVATMFVEFGFLTEKQVVELFKTKRKKKPAESE